MRKPLFYLILISLFLFSGPLWAWNLVTISGVVGEGAFYSSTIAKSCRFNDDDSAYMHKTPSVAGNLNIWTFSVWIKRGNLTSDNMALLDGYSTGSAYTLFGILTTGVIRYNTAGKSGDDIIDSVAVLRDVGSWYHLVCAVDTTQATAANRVKIYVNNTLQTMSGTYPDQNEDTFINDTNLQHLGTHYSGSWQFDGYMAEAVFIDGTQLTPSSFGESKAGVWIPKDVSALTYGTNGFHLDFADSANLGNDANGGTDLTEVNLAATDQVTDSPTNNYCVKNSIAKSGTTTLSEGNLKTMATANNYNPSTFFVNSGKWYWEVKFIKTGGGSPMIGITVPEAPFTGGHWPGQRSDDYGWFELNGNKYTNGAGVAYGNAWTTGDILMTALDMDNGEIWWGINGTWQATGNPATRANPAFTGISGRYTPVDTVTTANESLYYNFGQDSTNVVSGNADGNGYGDFEYAPPTDFLALCSANLSDPAWMTDYAEDYVDDGFNVVTYTGNGATRSITGVGHQPDMLVIKNRSAADEWKVMSTGLTGVDYHLSWDSTNIQAQDTGAVSSFDADGWTMGAGANGYNDNAENFVAYSWKESATYGFDIVTYTGTGAAHAENHSLGVVPELIIVKSLNESASKNHCIYHAKQNATPEDYYQYLNETTVATDDVEFWNDTAPTSTQFTVGVQTQVNENTKPFVAYLFAGIDGFSKFGSYTGNGNADGPFVYTGFKPATIIIHRIDVTSNWLALDSERSGYNVVDWRLKVETTNVDANDWDVLDIVSNGFKIRWTDAEANADAGTYVYCAFAENPFKYSNAR